MGSGLTSKVEALNTKWRQRQSGLARKSCGVSWRIEDDLYERLLILVDRHNRERIAKWRWEQTLMEIRKSQATNKVNP